MFTRQISINLKNERAFLFQKKFLAFFIFVCMFINGFMLSTVEIGKNSLFMISIAVTQNVVSSLISKCNDSLTEITEKVLIYVSNLLYADLENGAMSAKKHKEKSGEKNTSDVVSYVHIKKVKKSAGDAGTRILPGFIRGHEDVLCTVHRQNNSGSNSSDGLCLIIVFIVFVTAIVRRKEISADISNVLPSVRIRK